MIMDDASGRECPSRRAAPRSTQPPVSAGHSSKSTYFKFRGSKHRVTIRTAPGFLQVQGNELRQAKLNLQRLYTQEQHALSTGSAAANLPSIRSSRGTAERRYVNCLIRYLRDTKRMTGSQANELQGNFTRARMNEMVSNKEYLLGIYPHELN